MRSGGPRPYPVPAFSLKGGVGHGPRPRWLLHRRGHIEQAFLISPPFILKTRLISAKSLSARFSRSHISPWEYLAAPAVQIPPEGAQIFSWNVVAVAEIFTVPASSAYPVRCFHSSAHLSPFPPYSVEKMLIRPLPKKKQKSGSSTRSRSKCQSSRQSRARASSSSVTGKLSE